MFFMAVSKQRVATTSSFNRQEHHKRTIIRTSPTDFDLDEKFV